MALQTNARGTDAGKDATDTKENVFCLYLSRASSLGAVQNSLLDISDGDLQISNTYFTARASVKVLLDGNGPTGDARDVLQKCTAVMLVLSCAADIESSKNWWTSLSKNADADAVRLFAADFPFPEEDKLGELRTWGVENGIEVITPEICAEDEITVSERIRSALDCANWPQKTSLEDGLSVPGEAVRNQLRQQLRSENSVRRGLDDGDIERITRELLNLEDVESNSE